MLLSKSLQEKASGFPVSVEEKRFGLAGLCCSKGNEKESKEKRKSRPPERIDTGACHGRCLTACRMAFSFFRSVSCRVSLRNSREGRKRSIAGNCNWQAHGFGSGKESDQPDRSSTAKACFTNRNDRFNKQSRGTTGWKKRRQDRLPKRSVSTARSAFFSRSSGFPDESER